MAIDTTADDILELIRERGAEGAARVFRKDEFVPSKVQIELESQGEADLFLALIPGTATAIIEKLLARTKDEEVLKALCQHPRLPVTAMAEFARSDSASVRLTVAAHKQISPGTAALLAKDESPLVRATLARNISVPSRIALFLSSDPQPFVRAALAGRKGLDRDLLQRLVRDPDPGVTATAVTASKPSPSELLEWADSDEPLLQAGLLQRKDLDGDCFESLALSPHGNIATAAIEQRLPDPPIQVGLAKNGNNLVRTFLAAQSGLADEARDALSEDSGGNLKAVLAAAPDSSSDQLEDLARNADAAVADALLSRDDFSPRLAEMLSHSPDSAVLRLLALSGRDLPATALRRLLTHHDRVLRSLIARRGLSDSGLPENAAIACFADPSPPIRALGLASRHLPRTCVAEAARSPLPWLRLQAVKAPSLDSASLVQLQNDADAAVAAAAQQRARQRLSEIG